MNICKSLNSSSNISYEKCQQTLVKSTYSLLFIVSLLAIFFGVSGIIEHKSPDNLASLAMLNSDFFIHLEYHILIISGALCFTFLVGLIRNNSL